MGQLRGDEIAAVSAVVELAGLELGPVAEWRNPPGYPDALALCVLDAIWSLGVRYEAHVVPVLDAYRRLSRATGRDPATDGLDVLRGLIEEAGGAAGFADALGNRQRTSPHLDAPLKAQAVAMATTALISEGIVSAEDFRREVSADESRVRGPWRAVPGQRSTSIGWRYLRLLAGADDVKPDRMVRRFLDRCGVRSLPDAAAAAVVMAAAHRLGVPARVLDHAIWRHESALAQRGSSRSARIAANAGSEETSC